MKKIVVIIILSIFIITGCDKHTSEKNINQDQIKEQTNSFNLINDVNNLPEKEIVLNSTDIKEKLIKYGNHSLQVLDFKDNIIYGDYLNMNINNTILETKGLFDYNLTTKKLNYYKYNDKKRIWKYIIKNSFIYYIELSEKENRYEWALKKANKNFSNAKILDKGIVDIPIDAPFFVPSDSAEIYIVTINDNKESNIETTKIIRIKNDKIEELLKLEGNHKEEKGKFLKSPSNNVVIKNNKIIYTVVSYFDKEIIYEMDISNNKTKELFINDDLKNWSLFEIVLTDNYYLLNYLGKDNKGKLIILDSKGKTNEINCNGTKIIRALNNDIVVVKIENYYLGFSLIDKKFIYKYNLKANDYYPKYFIDNKIFIVTTLDGNEEIKYSYIK